MRPFFVTATEAQKLPRVLLLLLCAAYVIPGFIGRDPWLNDDAASFGVISTLLRGNWTDWLLPNVFGQSVFDEGPLFYWLGASFAKLVSFLEPHFAVRILSALLLALCLVCVWYATYYLAKRPEAQPADPFRLAANPTDFARAVADLSILVLMSCFGIIERTHETTSEVLQLSIVAVFLWSCTYSLQAPKLGGFVTGLAIAATSTTEGPILALALLITAISLPLLLRHYRLVAGPFLAVAVVTALAFALIWPTALYLGNSGSRTHLVQWLAASVPGWFDPLKLQQGLRWTIRSVPWYLWPIWPIAIWTLIRWRGAWRQPVIVLPVFTATVCALALLISGQANAAQMMVVVPPLTVLAALGLPTLAKSLTNLVDWLAVMIFSTFGLSIWLYYIALATGFPERMSRSAVRFANGYEFHVNWLWLALAAVATVAWLLVVKWRFSASPKPLWRTIVLSGSGLALVWLLLMTLWLPVFNHRKTYRDVSQEISQVLPARTSCLQSSGLTISQRAVLGYFLNVRFAEQGKTNGPCEWLLVADRTNKLLGDPDPSRWTLRWEGRRIADRQERVRLYSFAGQTSFIAEASSR